MNVWLQTEIEKGYVEEIEITNKTTKTTPVGNLWCDISEQFLNVQTQIKRVELSQTTLLIGLLILTIVTILK